MNMKVVKALGLSVVAGLITLFVWSKISSKITKTGTSAIPGVSEEGA